MVLDESVTMAFLVVLESMTPAERVAFVLHDVFRYPFAEIAGIVGRTPAACKQLASSARRRVTAGRGTEPAGAGRRTRCAQGQGGVGEQGHRGARRPARPGGRDEPPTAVGSRGAALRPIEGGARIAQYMVAIADKAPGLELLVRSVGGTPGLVARRDAVSS